MIQNRDHQLPDPLDDVVPATEVSVLNDLAGFGPQLGDVDRVLVRDARFGLACCCHGFSSLMMIE